MQTISLSDIIVPEDRQRKVFDETAIKDLAASILKPHGLMQPIVLRDDCKTLVAGERRLRAMRLLNEREEFYFHDGVRLGAFEIPFVKLSDLSLDQLREAELEENARRVDLSWQEKAKAIAALHAHLTTKAGAPTDFTETAKAIHGDDVNKRKIAEVADSVRLAEFLDDPLVANAKDVSQAKKAVRETAKWKDRKERLSTFNVASAQNMHLFHGDCFERAVTDLNGAKLDVLILDPPYGIDADKSGFSFDGQRHEYDDSDEYFTAICEALPRLCRSTLSAQAHVYVFCDIRRYSSLLASFMLNGFDVWPRPLIWNKGTVGSYANIEFGPRSCYDAILYANLGKKPVQKAAPDVITFQQEVTGAHPAHKPVAVYSELLSRSARPGDRAGDFFCGSGPIFKAAAAASCIAYGWEVNETYHEMSLDSIREVTK